MDNRRLNCFTTEEMIENFKNFLFLNLKDRERNIGLLKAYNYLTKSNMLLNEVTNDEIINYLFENKHGIYDWNIALSYIRDDKFPMKWEKYISSIELNKIKAILKKNKIKFKVTNKACWGKIVLFELNNSVLFAKNIKNKTLIDAYVYSKQAFCKKYKCDLI